MTRGALMMGVLAALTLTARAAPVVSIRARTEVSLDPIRREAGGLRISGLVRERGSGLPVPLATLRIDLDSETTWVTTAADGRFTEWLAVEGEDHRLAVEFIGDSQFDRSDTTLSQLDLSKNPLMLDVRAPAEHRRGDGPLPISIFASGEIDPVSVAVDVYIGLVDAPKLELALRVRTDDRGVANVSIEPNRLGPPGSLRVVADSSGDDDFDPARAEATVTWRSRADLRLEIPESDLAFDDRLVGRGRLTDDGGSGLAAQPVALVVQRPDGPATLDEAMTDELGRFALLAKASELGQGTHQVQAVFTPSSPYLDPARSEPAQITVAARRPVPVGYSLAALVAAIAAILAFVGMRKKPWQKWLARLRARTADDPSGLPADRQRSEPHHGLALARPSLVSTLRRPHDRGFAGVITSSVSGHMLDGAVLRLALETPREATTDGDGRFALEELPDGEHPATASAAGHVTEHFRITIPHRGELRGARIDLMPVRERIFSLYRQVAQPLLPNPELWGVWSPRQIVDHVRQSRSPGPLDDLTDYVEEAYFSVRAPDEDEISQAEERVRAAAEHLSRVARVDRRGPSEYSPGP